MKKFGHLGKIKELYSRGENIIQYLKSKDGSQLNTIEDILISYDFQSGSYIKGLSKNNEFTQKYCGALASIIENISGVESLLEVGVGEGTTLSPLLRKLINRPKNILGFDISWSRVKFAKELLQDFRIPDVNIFTGNLFEIPLLDNSIDVVYTSHSIEPNGGKEEEALKELYRITKKYLILLEPAYELASEEAKTRMRTHGYVTELFDTAQKLGYNIREHRLFDYSSNPLNPTGIIIIEKNTRDSNNSDLVCPISQSELIKYEDSFLYSEQSFLAYPILNSIPCLLRENAILASHLLTDYDKFKKEHNIDLQ